MNTTNLVMTAEFSKKNEINEIVEQGQSKIAKVLNYELSSGQSIALMIFSNVTFFCLGMMYFMNS